MMLDRAEKGFVTGADLNRLVPAAAEFIACIAVAAQ
jgi:hypothetical protein